MNSYILSAICLVCTFCVNGKPTENTHANELISSHPSLNDTYLIRHKRDSGCTKPAENLLWDQYLKYVTSQQNYHESFAMLSIFEKHIINRHLEKSSGNTDQLIEGRKEVCEAETDALAPLRERSSCPWYLVENKDQDRFPNSLMEANCSSCGDGITSNKYACRTQNEQSDSESMCVPMYYNVRVLRKTDDVEQDGHCKYEEGWQKLKTGCTCSRIGASLESK